MKKIILVLFLSAGADAFSQDIHFSQYADSPLNINPALAGTDKSYARGIMNYRSQWSLFDKGFQTIGASFDMPLVSGKGNSFLGAGLSVYQDKAGKNGLSKLYAAGSLSSIIKMAENNFFSLGIQGAFNQRSMDMGAFSWGNQFSGTAYDPSLPSGEAEGMMKKNFFDMSAGMAWIVNGNSSTLTGSDEFSMVLGAAVFHLLKPDQGFQGADKMNMRYNAFGKFSFGIGGNMSLQPSFAYWRQGTLSETNAGAMIRYLLKPESQHTGFERGMAVSIGGNYRLRDAIYPVLLFEYADYAIGISYDVNVSSLRPYSQSRGGFEIMLRYRDLNGLLFGQGGKHVKFI